MEVYALDKKGIIPIVINLCAVVISTGGQMQSGRSGEIYKNRFLNFASLEMTRICALTNHNWYKRHFIIRQRGDRMVVLSNGVHIILRDLVEHLFAASDAWLVYKKVYLPDIDKPLYVVAYQTKGYEQLVILLTDTVTVNDDLALQVRNRYAKRWAGCETSVQFLKSQIGLERFAVIRRSLTAEAGSGWVSLKK